MSSSPTYTLQPLLVGWPPPPSPPPNRFGGGGTGEVAAAAQSDRSCPSGAVLPGKLFSSSCPPGETVVGVLVSYLYVTTPQLSSRGNCRRCRRLLPIRYRTLQPLLVGWKERNYSSTAKKILPIRYNCPQSVLGCNNLFRGHTADSCNAAPTVSENRSRPSAPPFRRHRPVRRQIT